VNSVIALGSKSAYSDTNKNKRRDFRPEEKNVGGWGMEDERKEAKALSHGGASGFMITSEQGFDIRTQASGMRDSKRSLGSVSVRWTTEIATVDVRLKATKIRGEELGPFHWQGRPAQPETGQGTGQESLAHRQVQDSSRAYSCASIPTLVRDICPDGRSQLVFLTTSHPDQVITWLDGKMKAPEGRQVKLQSAVSPFEHPIAREVENCKSILSEAWHGGHWAEGRTLALVHPAPICSSFRLRVCSARIINGSRPRSLAFDQHHVCVISVKLFLSRAELEIFIRHHALS
jgi:hypothetical protein